ncbi:MAG: AAA family ATPase [Acidipropionibacterium sp.]|nr:AAA family ATPase [Acidipropionibacterium sp.]
MLVEPAGGDGPRSRKAAEIAAQAIRTQWVIPAIVGPSGVGKTHMLGAVAAKLAGIPRPRSVWRFTSEVAEINAVSALRAVLAQIDEPALVVLDDFETHAGLDANRPDRDLMAAIISASDHPFARVAVVVDQRFDARIGLLSPAFDMALQRVQVNQLVPSLVDRIVRERADQLSTAQDVTIEDAAKAAAMAVPMSREDGVHPGLAISRLDAAVARAVIAGERLVRVEHLASDSTVTAREGTRTFEELLREGVKGQDEAIEKVASRLALTRVGIDLRPERPNGVFLFVGPTGVGKTQLAKEIALHEYGGADRIIRIDMSEYAHGSASSKLIGSGPGYIGSDQPEGWLTTKVAQMPRSVVLLDEIEKADPSIWNNFLQVFDAGRMTDGRGVTVSFSDTIIVMTSNLGVREASHGVAGFGNTTDAGDMSARVLSVVRNEMAPELLNRIDEIIPFNALSPEAILEITHKELADARTRLLASGWTVDWTDDVPRWLAETGYDPAYGARHLQRNIEHELLTRLARLAQPHMTVYVVDGTLAVRGG